MWTEVGAGLETLNDRARGVALHAPPGDRAPWLPQRDQVRWKVTFMVGSDGFIACGETPLAAVQSALGFLSGIDHQPYIRVASEGG